MGLIASIYKDRGRSFSNGGISARYDEVLIVNVDGPFEPHVGRPNVMLVRGNVPGSVKMVVAEQAYDGGWHEVSDDRMGPMMGGTYVGTSDARLREAVRALGSNETLVPLHDRYETAAEYAALSQ